jgi:soluble lytic murein transglycosylase-like protein
VFVEDIPYRETRDYIKKVLANLEMYGRLYGADIEPWPHTVRASAPGGVDF